MLSSNLKPKTKYRKIAGLQFVQNNLHQGRKNAKVSDKHLAAGEYHRL